MTKQSHLDQTKEYGDPCSLCTGRNHPYMVKFELWKQVFPKAKCTTYIRDELTGRVEVNTPGFFSCIPCFEKELGRDLVPDDFLDAPINSGYFRFDAITYCSLPRTR